ncbi:hypothetical protein [Nostoc sp. PA-18-2419]|nr:hypothetical protein [Nostoc sp. PA-18-2419]
MITAKIASQICYVTNIDAETTNVLVPIELWQSQMINIWQY